MNSEEARKHQARSVGEMTSHATFNLRDVGLAQAFAELSLQRNGQFVLGHFPTASAESPFNYS